jgi:E3 ubiquitin-protein ligase RGLG
MNYIGKVYSPHENAIRDDYSTLEELDQAVKDVGLVRSQLIFGIDYTISNLETGKNSFNGLSLHHIEQGLLNPYQSVSIIIQH